MRHHDVLGVIQVRKALPHYAAPTLPLRRSRLGTNSVIREDIYENALVKPGFFRFIGYKTCAFQHNLRK